MNITISRRQQKLYDARGFNLHRWQHLIEEGNQLRKEIKAIAQEYDVEWDELTDEKQEKVKEALKNERTKKNSKSEDKKDDKDDKDDD